MNLPLFADWLQHHGAIADWLSASATTLATLAALWLGLRGFKHAEDLRAADRADAWAIMANSLWKAGSCLVIIADSAAENPGKTMPKTAFLAMLEQADAGVTHALTQNVADAELIDFAFGFAAIIRAFRADADYQDGRFIPADHISEGFTPHRSDFDRAMERLNAIHGGKST